MGWGAGVALENDMQYTTTMTTATANDIMPYCFQISGRDASHALPDEVHSKNANLGTAHAYSIFVRLSVYLKLRTQHPSLKHAEHAERLSEPDQSPSAC